MAQVNINKSTTFEVPFLGAKAYGFDVDGNPVMINEDGTTTILGVNVAAVANIVANKGVGPATSLPETFTVGDIYVTWDSKKVYTAVDAISWSSVDLQDGQFITDTSQTFINLYQYKNFYLYSIGLTSGTQNIEGIKTFTSFPKTPESAPVNDYDVANKKYVIETAGGLWDDRGNYDASGNAFPATGGSGTGGSIQKADIWTISVGGTLGGVSVVEGQTIRALSDAPGQTSTNWAISIGALVNDLTAIHTDESSEIHGLTEKTVLEDNDEIILENSSGNVWSKIRAKLSYLKTYLGLLFSTDVTELKANGTASLGIINKLPKIDHVHPLSNQIIFGGETISVPGTINIIETAADNAYMYLNLGQSLTQEFRNEIVEGAYLPAFNDVSVWIWGTSIVRLELFRGGVDGTLLAMNEQQLLGNGQLYYIIAVVPASPLELFTLRVTRINAGGFAAISKSNPPYSYANAVLNGVVQSSSAYFFVSATSIVYTTPVHTVEADTDGILFKINGTDVFRIDANGVLKSLTTDYEDLVINDNDIPNRKFVLDNSEKEVYNTYIVGATPLAAGWLSLTVGGAALTPLAEKIYIVLTDGEYKNFQYRWTGTAYESIGGGGQLSGSVAAANVTEITDGNVQTALDNLRSSKANMNDIMKSRLETISLTATAAGTTTLVLASNYMQFFTGSTTQTIVLPDVTTLVLGFDFFIKNNSTEKLTINSSGGNRIMYLMPNCGVILKCISLSGTGIDSWDIAANTEPIYIPCSDISTALTAITVAKPAFAFNFTLVGVFAYVNTAPTGLKLIVDLNNGSNSFLSTKLSIDATEKSSLTAATAAVIDSNYKDYTAGDDITIDIDQIGSTIAGKGLIVGLDVIKK